MVQRIPVIQNWPTSVYQKWAYNYCVRNAWRVTNVFGEFEDCMSECALVYVECRLRYGGTVNSEAQFMCLYKMMVSCYFATVSKRDKKKRDSLEATIIKKLETVYPEAHLNVMLSEASQELKEVLQIFLAAPQEVLQTLRLESNSHNLKRFWQQVVMYVGINQIKADGLALELRGLLT